jgi:hypothetical protein
MKTLIIRLFRPTPPPPPPPVTLHRRFGVQSPESLAMYRAGYAVVAAALPRPTAPPPHDEAA